MSKPRAWKASGRAWGTPGELPERHPAYRRREPAQASAWNVRSCAPIQRRRKATVEVDRPAARGRAHKRRTRKGQSTDAEAQWRTAPW